MVSHQDNLRLANILSKQELNKRSEEANLKGQDTDAITEMLLMINSGRAYLDKISEVTTDEIEMALAIADVEQFKANCTRLKDKFSEQEYELVTSALNLLDDAKLKLIQEQVGRYASLKETYLTVAKDLEILTKQIDVFKEESQEAIVASGMETQTSAERSELITYIISACVFIVGIPWFGTYVTKDINGKITKIVQRVVQEPRNYFNPN